MPIPSKILLDALALTREARTLDLLFILVNANATTLESLLDDHFRDTSGNIDVLAPEHAYALHVAANENGPLAAATVRYLLKHGADPLKEDLSGRTPLIIATRPAHSFKPDEVEQQPSEVWLALLDAAVAAEVEASVLKTYDDGGNNILHIAAGHGLIDHLRVLHERFPGVSSLADQANSEGYTPFQVAFNRVAKTYLEEGLVPRTLSPTLQFLTDGLGADPDVRYRRDGTAMHVAARTSSVALLTALVEAGCAATALDRDGRTPRDVARRKVHDFGVLDELFEAAEAIRLSAVVGQEVALIDDEKPRARL